MNKEKIEEMKFTGAKERLSNWVAGVLNDCRDKIRRGEYEAVISMMHEGLDVINELVDMEKKKGLKKNDNRI